MMAAIRDQQLKKKEEGHRALPDRSAERSSCALAIAIATAGGRGQGRRALKRKGWGFNRPADTAPIYPPIVAAAAQLSTITRAFIRIKSELIGNRPPFQ